MATVTYPCYWQKKDNSGFWYWIYYARNGQAIARSSESYVKRDDCMCIPVMLTPISSDCDPLALEVLAHLFQRW